MITRNVFMKFREEYQEEQQLRTIADETNRVLDLVDSIKVFSIGLPADPTSKKAWDLSLAVMFDSLEDLELYRKDSVHREYVDQFLKPRLEVIKAWNFQHGE